MYIVKMVYGSTNDLHLTTLSMVSRCPYRLMSSPSVFSDQLFTEAWCSVYHQGMIVINDVFTLIINIIVLKEHVLFANEQKLTKGVQRPLCFYMMYWKKSFFCGVTNLLLYVPGLDFGITFYCQCILWLNTLNISVFLFKLSTLEYTWKIFRHVGSVKITLL